MKITAQFSFWGGLVFAALCGAYGLYGLMTLEAGLSDAQRADYLGFALFWLFLGAIGATMAIVSRLMMRGRLGGLGD